MFLVDRLILVGGILLALGIASSKFSARFGVPVLVLFLGLGMLAGSDGPGGIHFEDYTLAHAIGTLALALILFDGGLSTPLEAIRTVWRPALSLATVGVLITAVVTGLAATRILGISPLEGLLLGSIVGSTDAAAVFGILRSGGIKLPERLTAILEIESGSNDPMAVFMTVGCIELIDQRAQLGLDLAALFVTQMAVGAIVGLVVGGLAVWIVNRINLDAAGLYPVLATTQGLLSFGLAAWMGGSGFLAVYLTGIVLGNSRLVFQRGIFLFHDAAAWLSQIVMFVVLGLLSFPSRLPNITGQALLVGAALIFVARPLAVAVSLLPFRVTWREYLLISWVGLKGAVPITLATFPLMFNVQRASLLFDVVFFVVLASALVQGWTLPLVARRLGLQMSADPTPPVTLEISSLRHVDGDIVDYAVTPDSRVAGRRVRELALPEGVVIAIISRHQRIIPPQGDTRIEVGDHVVVVMRPEARPLVNRVFTRNLAEFEQLPPMLEFPLRGRTTVGEIEQFYGIPLHAPYSCTLDEALRHRLVGQPPQLGTVVRFGKIAFYIRRLTGDGHIEHVGMVIVPEQMLPASDE